ncbi:MAG: type II secretion system F family protein [Desulfobacca sp.]|uniref:type II secretion system F family protein n=1 Tax=Desulfobacca sp. TaxID=2067990 RepID=UPI00404A851A
MFDFIQNLIAWFYPKDGEFPGIIPVTVFLCILFLLQGLSLLLGQGGRQSDKRIRARLQFIQELENRLETASLLKTDNLRPASRMSRWLAKITRIFNLEELLLQADIPWKSSTVIIFCFGLGGLAGIYGLVQFGPLAALGAFLAAGYLLPQLLLRLKKQLRLKKFEKQLPEALGLMARSLKAGHSFPSAMQLVADEMPNPIGIEFFKTFKEYNYGLDFNDVMMNLYRRNQLKDLKFFITAVLIQRETGGNLVEILEKIASLIRERFKLLNHIKALTAEGRLSGLILIGLPIIIALILYRLNPRYISLLWTHPTGKLMLGVAIFFQVLGMIVIKKIVSIKV